MEARNAVPQLIAALRDEASVVRRASLLALADIGDVSCLPALRRLLLLSDEDPEVRHDTGIAIFRLPLPPNRNAGIASDENDNINSGDASTRRNDDDRCTADDFFVKRCQLNHRSS
jgi:HEAT repeat protein